MLLKRDLTIATLTEAVTFALVKKISYFLFFQKI